MDVTIVIPTKNGGKQFESVLEMVEKQKTQYSYEVICVDSGSADQTVEIIKKHSYACYQIKPEEFGHGRTRNYGASKGTGEYIVFLTQDALPADENWLENLVTPMKMDRDIVGAFGSHIPYEDCNPFDKRDIEAHFKGFGVTNTIYYIDDWNRYFADEGYRHVMAFFSDNNSCLRRSVWEKWPYEDVDFAEDQIWVRSMLEKGFKKVYCPDAAVYHSHNYDVETYFGRYFDEYRSLYRLHHFILTRGLKSIRQLTNLQIENDQNYIRSLGLNQEEEEKWEKYAKKRAKYRYRAAYLAEHYDTMPKDLQACLDKDISQQYKQIHNIKYQKFTFVTKLKLAKWILTGRKPVDLSPVTSVKYVSGIGMSDVPNAYGYVMNDTKIAFSEADYHNVENEIILNWIVPEMGPGSGGHINIFRFLTGLQEKGIHNRIYILKKNKIQTDEELRCFLKEYFAIDNKDIEMYVDVNQVKFAHGTIATSWDTAYFVKHFDNTISKFYFVQDFEPYFYAQGSEYIFAENTYKFGFRGITAGDWLKDKLRDEYGMQTESFGFSYDKDIYKSIEKRDAVPRVFFYARPVTPRRSFELGLLALHEIAKRIPELEVVLAGWDVSSYVIPFNYKSLGIVKVEDLSEIYSQCDMCLVLSNTNLSLLPLEVMASNSVAVCTKGANSEWLVNESNCVMVDFDPLAIAETVEYYFKNPEQLADIRKKGLQFALSTSWESEIDKVNEFIRKGIKEDEEKKSFGNRG